MTIIFQIILSETESESEEGDCQHVTPARLFSLWVRGRLEQNHETTTPADLGWPPRHSRWGGVDEGADGTGGTEVGCGRLGERWMTGTTNREVEATGKSFTPVRPRLGGVPIILFCQWPATIMTLKWRHKNIGPSWRRWTPSRHLLTNTAGHLGRQSTCTLCLHLISPMYTCLRK